MYAMQASMSAIFARSPMRTASRLFRLAKQGLAQRGWPTSLCVSPLRPTLLYMLDLLCITIITPIIFSLNLSLGAIGRKYHTATLTFEPAGRGGTLQTQKAVRTGMLGCLP